jgi:hypothetical protein
MNRLVHAFAVVALVLLVGCGEDKAKINLGAGCTLSSDCATGLLCKFEKCHTACVQSRDCEGGASCVQVDGVGVCQAADARVCKPGCPAPLMCGPGNQCRNVCSPTLPPCLTGQVCQPEASGTSFCVDVATSDAGGGTPDAGAGSDAPVTSPGTSADAAVTPMTDTGGPATGTPDAPPATACGKAAEACCPDKTCGAGLACTTGAQRCTCVEKCGGEYILRKDGAIIWKSTNILKGADGQPWKAMGARDIVGNRSSSAAYQGGCVATAEGAVWCWGNNTNGRLGAGMTEAMSTAPVQVVTSARTPLTGIQKLSTYHLGLTTCAIGEGGKVWCWGYGGTYGLGTGFPNDSNVAVPVVVSAGGAQLADATHISVSQNQVCARNSAGKVFCWGYYLSKLPVEIKVLDPIESVGCTLNFCCGMTPGGNVWCWGSKAPYDEGSKLLFGAGGVGGAAVADVTGVYESKDNHDLYLLRKDLSVLSVYTSVEPLTVAGVAVTAPHHMGAGCFITDQGKHHPTDWVPFCQ